MRSVKRVQKPQILVDNEVRWTAALLNEMKSGKTFSEVKASIKNKYKHKEIKAALEVMYEDYCCFCEGDYGLTGYPEVEHYKPKADNPKLCFKWDNLNYICSKCNKNKNDKWDDDYPILNPTKDNIEEHLGYDKNVLVYDVSDKRAENTEKHLELNREKLLKKRTELYNYYVIAKKQPSKKDVVIEVLSTGKDYMTYRNYVINLINAI